MMTRKLSSYWNRIGIGAALTGCSPPTPPGMRVRTRRFEKLRL